jgi:hypothetical protein
MKEREVKEMKFITAVTLALGLFQSLFLCHVFVVLAWQGEYLIREPVRWIAILEIFIFLVIAGLFVERLSQLKEVKRKAK